MSIRIPKPKIEQDRPSKLARKQSWLKTWKPGTRIVASDETVYEVQQAGNWKKVGKALKEKI